MKVWEKISELSGKRNIDEIKNEYDSNCPAVVDYKYNVLGEKKMKTFCGLGCSVSCMDEYLNRKI